MKNFLLLSFLIMITIQPMIHKFIVPTKDVYLWETTDTPEKISSKLNTKSIGTVYYYVKTETKPNELAPIIKTFSINNIKVQALNGEPEWVNNQKEVDKFLSTISGYNRTDKPKIDSIHLDIESYLLPTWKTNQKEVILRYQKMIQYIEKWGKNEKVQIIYDIPYWWHTISYKNENGNGNLASFVLEHSSGVNLMSYRDQANGKNGIIEISKPIVTLGIKLKKPVTISLELSPSNEGNYVTFYDNTKESLETEVKKIEESLKTRIAYHHYRYLK